MAKRVFFGLSGLLLLGGLVLAGTVGRWWIHDEIKLLGYEPAAELTSIAAAADLSEYGERLFYVHRPEVLEPSDFNAACSDGTVDHSDETYVLGCYDGRGIYIFDVQDEQLENIEKITAAHEMLHAAYERLSDSEKADITEGLLVVEAGIQNQRILATIDSYGDLPEPDRLNELHSIIGTEVAELPQFLEDYYSQYFNDRQVVVGLSQEYEHIFTEIRDQIEAFDEQLTSLSLRISGVERELESRLLSIDERRALLPPLLEQERFEEYNALVRDLQRDVAAYNSQIDGVQNLIAEYNQVVTERNELGQKQNDLVQGINSRYEEVEEVER